MGRWIGSMLVLVGLVVPSTAEVVCDGVDDFLLTAAATNVLVGTTEGTLTVVVKATAPTPGTAEGCFSGELLLANTDAWLGLTRLANYGGVGEDRMCAYRYTAVEDEVVTPYFLDIFLHLAWHHASDTLTLLADGVPMGNVGSGTIADPLAGPLGVCSSGGAEVFTGVVAHAAAYPTAVPQAMLAATGASRLYWIVPTVASGDWPLAECTDGSSGHGVAFRDHSGSGHSLTGNHGPDATGLTCQGATAMSYPWGVE